MLARYRRRWNRVIDGWPSTHILKPESRDYPTSIYDEEFGARFARESGSAAFRHGSKSSRACRPWSSSVTTVPRRPRRGRLRQEDFNQVLGAAGNQKYQKYGGKVSLKSVAQVFAATGDQDSLERLFKLVVVSVAVGNLDMHAKNISLLHRPDGSITLSPAYDVVPQAHQPNDGEVALAVDGEYRHAAITLDHLDRRGTSVGANQRSRSAEETLATVLQIASTQAPHRQAYAGLVDDISGFTAAYSKATPSEQAAVIVD